jgi:hypothetical protein
MSNHRIAVFAFALAALSGCASAPQGTEQVKVDTNPGGADCALERQGKVIARIPGTPGFTTISKSWRRVTVRCQKPGYREATFRADADLFYRDAGESKGDTTVLLYDVVVNLTLVPMDATATAAPSVLAFTPSPVSVSPAAK